MDLANADLTYVLPIRREEVEQEDELPAYLAWLAKSVPVIVVDGSPQKIYAHHARNWPQGVLHVPPDDDRRADRNGKAAGVVTGLRRVRTAKAVIADDDVRYDDASLARLAGLLDAAEIVRPQNVFAPMPWHALLDTGRTLVARALGGDWPGTLGVRLTAFDAAGGYDGDVLFENLEFVRTLRAAGAREHVALDLFVIRRPCSVRRYREQRVRQAYDEFARPPVLAAQLAVAPLTLVAIARWGVRALAGIALVAIATAEYGRRRGNGAGVFPMLATLCSPAWVAERGITSWIALAMRFTRGGVRYAGGRVRVAAHSVGTLRRRHEIAA